MIASKKERWKTVRHLGMLFFLGLLIPELPLPTFFTFGIKALFISEAEAQFPLCEEDCKIPEPFQEPETRCDTACTIKVSNECYGDACYGATTCGAAGYPCSGWGEPTPEGDDGGDETPEGDDDGDETPQAETGTSQGSWCDDWSREGVEWRNGSTSGRAVLSGGHIGCNLPGFCTSGLWHGAPGGSWIWSSANVTPQEAESGSSVRFYERMCLPETFGYYDITLNIAADNAYEVFYVSDDAARTRQLLVASGSNNFSDYTSHSLPSPTEQCQTIEISVSNFGVLGSTPYTNPAGVSYHLHMNVWN